MATLLSTAPNYRGAGIHQYSSELLNRLPKQAPQFDYHAFLMERGYSAPMGVAVSTPRWLSPSPSKRIFWEQTRVLLESRRLDLIHGFAYALPVLSRTPAVVTVHDLTFILFPQAFPRRKQRYLSFITRSSCQQAQIVIADSHATAADLQRLLDVPKEKIRVIYTGVDKRYRPLQPCQVDEYRQKKGWPERFILMVGTIEPRKNHLGLIEAYSRYRRMSHHPLPLLIGGGKGWRFEYIFRHVQTLGLEKDVNFLGFVPWEDMPWLYNAATLFVYPSHYEGFGLPVAEAMRCGTPIITSSTSSLPEVVGDAGLTVNPNNPEELAHAMLTVLEKEPDRLQIMQEQGLRQAARFTWEKTAIKTAEVYSRVLDRAHD